MGRNEARSRFKSFEKFISDTFFDGKNISITPIEESERLEVYFDDGGNDNELHHLGDGIQAVMLLAYKLFTAAEGTWLFIEEPEINLHPAYQRIFLSLIAENEEIKKKNLVIFFTTHSNHLLDLTITEQYKEDIAIFLFNKVDKIRKSVRQVNSQDLRLLDALGVHNSSVFMANCSIWVEGISDRIYIRNYLKAYLKVHEDEKAYKEDLHYCFFEYAGANLAHYSFEEDNSENIDSRFLANRIMVIADKDEGQEKKHEKLKVVLGDNYEILEVREIENLWKGAYLKAKLPEVFTKLKKEQLQGLSFEEESQEFKNKYLRETLYEKLQEANKNRAKEDKIDIPASIKFDKEPISFKSDIKKDLANATKDISWGEMSKAAQNLTLKVYEFIAKHNDQASRGGVVGQVLLV